jgi:hypothetical protein
MFYVVEGVSYFTNLLEGRKLTAVIIEACHWCDVTWRHIYSLNRLWLLGDELLWTKIILCVIHFRPS